jgi:hypothetical protein
MTSHNSGDANGIYNVLAIPETVNIEVRKEFKWNGLFSQRLTPGLYVAHVEIDPNFICGNGVGVWNLQDGYWETAYVTSIRSLAHYTNSTLLFDIDSPAKVEIRMTESCDHQHIINGFTEKIDLELIPRQNHIPIYLRNGIGFLKNSLRFFKRFR